MERTQTRRTAILVDGAYYRVRARHIWGDKSPYDRAAELYSYCMLHITESSEPRDLYRIFYYDCPPMTRTIRHPLTRQEVNYANMPGTRWANDFYRFVVEKRKVALRMGELAESAASFVLKGPVLEELLSGERAVTALEESDFRLDVKQKGVDMRVGLDVASLAGGGYVDQIILIAGDSDFLPVVKMARRSGIDFLLDPMKQNPKRSMVEHVDGIECYTDWL